LTINNALKDENNSNGASVDINKEENITPGIIKYNSEPNMDIY
tara:strand:+ start:263 stop:391 length:129 start_codon:yes stop_codon:yes gene_type:complete